MILEERERMDWLCKQIENDQNRMLQLLGELNDLLERNQRHPEAAISIRWQNPSGNKA